MYNSKLAMDVLTQNLKLLSKGENSPYFKDSGEISDFIGVSDDKFSQFFYFRLEQLLDIDQRDHNYPGIADHVNIKIQQFDPEDPLFFYCMRDIEAKQNFMLCFNYLQLPELEMGGFKAFLEGDGSDVDYDEILIEIQERDKKEDIILEIESRERDKQRLKMEALEILDFQSRVKNKDSSSNGERGR